MKEALKEAFLASSTFQNHKERMFNASVACCGVVMHLLPNVDISRFLHFFFQQ